MKFRIATLFLSLTFLCASQAQATLPETLATFGKQQILTESNAHGSDLIHKAFKIAGMQHGWEVVKDDAGGMRMTLLVRNRHKVTIDVLIDNQSAEINYVDSANMDYVKIGNEEKIHPSYRKWILTLLQDTRTMTQIIMAQNTYK